MEIERWMGVTPGGGGGRGGGSEEGEVKRMDAWYRGRKWVSFEGGGATCRMGDRIT